MPLCLTRSILRYGSRVSGAIQEKELDPLLYLGVVVIEKGAFGSSSTIVGQPSNDWYISMILNLKGFVWEDTFCFWTRLLIDCCLIVGFILKKKKNK